MKKLLVALVLGVILTATLATPAFAGEGKGNMGGKNAGIGPDDTSIFLKNPHDWGIGLINGLYYHMARGWGCIAQSRNLLSIASGQPPAGCPW